MVLTSMEAVKAFLLEQDRAIILCKSHTCSVCLSIEARFMNDADLYKDWSMAQVYVDDVALFRGEHSVFTVPTVLMFFEGKEIYRTSRFIEFDRIQYFVEAVGN